MVSYHQRENKVFRIIIRNIHSSTLLNEVGISIQEIDFTVPKVYISLYKITKIKLPLFFADVEPADFNKDIVHITSTFILKLKLKNHKNVAK